MRNQLQLIELLPEFDKLQLKHGDSDLDSVYGAGKISNPDLMLVFMNPTARNLSSSKTWRGLKAPWIATKNVWRMLFQLGLIDEAIFERINVKKPSDWDYDFAKKVYQEVESRSIYITNLSKATQVDARPLRNKVFRDYLDLFYREIELVEPKVIIAFGNQVSSVLLGKNTKVSESRKKRVDLEVNGNQYKIYPVYYPVGQGMRNIGLAKEDIRWIIKQELC